MMRILTGTMVAGLLLACGGDVPRPAETAQADRALVPIGDTLVDTVAEESVAEDTLAPAEESTPVAATPRPRPERRARRAAPRAAEPETTPVTANTAPARDTVAVASAETLSTAEQPPLDSAEFLPPADTSAPPADIESTTAPTTDTAPTVDTAPTPVPTPVPAPARTPDTIATARPIPAPRPTPVVPETSGPAATEAIPAGAELHAALVDSINSRRDTAGHAVMARLMENIAGKDGRTLLPAGSTVRLTIVRLEPARSKGANGRLKLRVDSIAVAGSPMQVAAEVRPVPHELRGRGVTGSEAAKVGAGAAAGAVAGRVLGGDTRGAVIGGVVGAAGGAVVASQTATRDVVVKAGTPISFVLTAPLMAPRPLTP